MEDVHTQSTCLLQLVDLAQKGEVQHVVVG